MPHSSTHISWNLQYQPDAVLAETGGLVLARGWRRADSQRVLLRYPRHAEHADGAARLRTEANMVALLQSCDAVLTPMEGGLLQGEHVPALVYPHFAGLPLSLGTPLDNEPLIQLARDAARALAQVHRRGVVHRDLKPASFLYDAATRSLRLTHFGQAARLLPGAAPPMLLADSLAYLPPEQTGRMAYEADPRADLYSLGILLFALATGTLPFHADDALGYAHPTHGAGTARSVAAAARSPRRCQRHHLPSAAQSARPTLSERRRPRSRSGEMSQFVAAATQHRRL